MPVYTLGAPALYDEMLGSGPATKLGPCTLDDGTPYAGGIAFASPEDAEAWAREQGKPWLPYLLDGTWPDDVTFDAEAGHYRIRRDLTVLRRA